MKWVLAVLLLLFLGFVMQSFWLGSIPTPAAIGTAHCINFFLAHIGVGVGRLVPVLLVALVARLVLRKHQIAALIIVTVLSFLCGLFAQMGELLEQGISREDVRWHPRAIACGFAYATIIAVFWLGVKGLWRMKGKPASAPSKPHRSPSTGESAPEDSACPQTPRPLKSSNRKDGRTMTLRQKALLLVGGSIIVVMCAIPPWYAQVWPLPHVRGGCQHCPHKGGDRTWMRIGYRPIADPRGYSFKTSDIEKYNVVYQYRIAITQLIVQVLGVAVATGVLVVVSGQRRKPRGDLVAKGADDNKLMESS